MHLTIWIPLDRPKIVEIVMQMVWIKWGSRCTGGWSGSAGGGSKRQAERNYQN